MGEGHGKVVKFRRSYVAGAGGSVSEAMHAVSRRRIWSCSLASRLASMCCSTRRTAVLAVVICAIALSLAYPVRDDIPVLLVDEARRPAAGS